MRKADSQPRTATVRVTLRLPSILSLVILCVGASAFANDAVEEELRLFLPRLQAAAKRGPAAVVPLVRFPLRVNGSSGKVLMLSAADFTASFRDVFEPNVLARLAAATPDEVSTDRGMVGNGALYIEVVCVEATKCEHPVPRVTVVNTHMPPMAVPGVDYKETHCRYDYKGRNYPCSADNWLLRWLYDRPLLF